MKELRIFKNNNFGKIRSVIIGNKQWFMGKNTAEILGYSNKAV